MTNTEIKRKIFESDEFVIAELQKVQTLYTLKRVIRYNHSRTIEADAESDAEHIFGMHCLVDYFLPLESDSDKLDHDRICTMVQYHDMNEIITGDTIGYHKSPSDQANEHIATKQVLNQLPEIMRATIKAAIDEYENQTTREARFAKALDKIEPFFHLYNETGKRTLATLKTTKDQSDRIKFPYLQDFPVIKRFAEVMTTQFEKEGFYHPAAW